MQRFARTYSLPFFLAFLMLLSLPLAGCTSQGQKPASGRNEKVELLVGAAASLTDAFKEIQTRYEVVSPSVKLSFTFGASGALQQQIEQGAPVDVFVSASAANMKSLVDKKLIDPARSSTLLRNELVAITPSDSKQGLQKIDELTQPAFQHIAIGEPRTVPAGNYAMEALTAGRLWDQLQPKLVLAKDVRQVLAYVESGNAEAGFVYKTDAASSKSVKVAFEVDRASYTSIDYPAGVVTASKHDKEAEAFYSFLRSEEAKAIFVRYGFTVPE